MSTTIVKCANPFATRFISPGRIDFVSPRNTKTAVCQSTDILQQLVQDFSDARFVAQIVGPHGCGKSALAIEVSRQLGSSFDFVRSLVVRRNGVFGLSVQHDTGGGDGRGLILLDGVENLSAFNRTGLIQSCYKQGIGLLITCHRRLVGLDLLATLSPSVRVFQDIVAKLTIDCEVKFDSEIVAKVFSQTSGDYREGLMKMFDLYQGRES